MNVSTRTAGRATWALVVVWLSLVASQGWGQIVCGDGIVDPGEACDGGDCCSPECTPLDDGFPTVTVNFTDQDPVPLDGAGCSAVMNFEIVVTDDCCVDATNLNLLTDSRSLSIDADLPIVGTPQQVSETEVRVTGIVRVERPFDDCSGIVQVEASAVDCAGNRSSTASDSATARDQTEPGFGSISFSEICWESSSDFEAAARFHLDGIGFDNCDNNLNIVTLESDTTCEATLRLALQDECENRSAPAVFTGFVDGIEPRIEDPEPIAECYDTEQEAVDAAKAAAEAATTDNCEGELTFRSFTDFFGCEARIEVTAEDECENRSDSAVFVTDIDPSPPFADCNATTLPYEVNDQCVAYVEYRGSISDICCVDRGSIRIEPSIQSGGATITFNQFDDCDITDFSGDDREFEIECRIKVSALTDCEVLLQIELTGEDCCGRALEPACTTTATIVDTTPPQVTCPESITLDRGDMICGTQVQEWLHSGAVTDNCGPRAAVTDAPECGFPYGSTTTVTFSGGDNCEGPTCTSDITIGPAPRTSTTKKGSLLAYSKVDLRWNEGPGGLTLLQDTILTITNDAPQDVFVQLYFVNGDAPLDAILAGDPPMVIQDAEPGWNWVDCQVELTQDQPMYWSAWSGNPLGCQPFTVLDGGMPAGRPDPDNPGGRMLRGFVYAWAVNNSGHEIRWDHLSGNATIVDYPNTAAWEYEAFAFQGTCGDQGIELLDCIRADAAGVCCDVEAIPGRLDVDGVQYEFAYGQLLLNFFAVGSTALSGGGASVQADTDLTLFPLSQDLRQDSLGPVLTKAHFDIWNANEHRLSGTTRCISCWDQTLMSRYTGLGVINNFLLPNLQTDAGKARIDGMLSEDCDLDPRCPLERLRRANGIGHTAAAPEQPVVAGFSEMTDAEFQQHCSQEASLLGVSAKWLSFSAAPPAQIDYAGSPLIGMSVQSGTIQYDIIAPPGTLRDSRKSIPRADDRVRNVTPVVPGH